MKPPDMNPDHVPGALRIRSGVLTLPDGDLDIYLFRWADDADVTPDTPVNIVRHDTLVALLDELRMLRHLGA